MIALQTRYNLLNRSFEDDLAPMCRELGLGTAPWGCLAEGFLTGKHKKETKPSEVGSKRLDSVINHGLDEHNWKILDVVNQIAQETKRTASQVSINWMLRKGITSPIVGARTVQQMEDNLGALEFVLTDEQMYRLDEVSKPTSSKPFPHDFLTTMGKNILSGSNEVEHPSQYKSLFV